MLQQMNHFIGVKITEHISRRALDLCSLFLIATSSQALSHAIPTSIDVINNPNDLIKHISTPNKHLHQTNRPSLRRPLPCQKFPGPSLAPPSPFPCATSPNGGAGANTSLALTPTLQPHQGTSIPSASPSVIKSLPMLPMPTASSAGSEGGAPSDHAARCPFGTGRRVEGRRAEASV
jgi:hypothetical protein